MNVVAAIFARGGSKGLPRKNIRTLAGKPLIAWAIEHARTVPRIRRVIVSTDSYEIAEIAKNYGAEVPFIRPKELARDDSPEWFAWRHTVEFLEMEEGVLPDAMLCVPATAPLRLPVDLENCLDEFEKGDADTIITVTEAHRSPWFNMVKVKPDNSVELVITSDSTFVRRQDVPVVYDMTTVAYVVNPKFILQNQGIFDGRVRAVKIPVERALDIDTLMDFELAEYFINHRNQFK